MNWFPYSHVDIVVCNVVLSDWSTCPENLMVSLWSTNQFRNFEGLGLHSEFWFHWLMYFYPIKKKSHRIQIQLGEKFSKHKSSFHSNAWHLVIKSIETIHLMLKNNCSCCIQCIYWVKYKSRYNSRSKTLYIHIQIFCSHIKWRFTDPMLW